MRMVVSPPWSDRGTIIGFKEKYYFIQSNKVYNSEDNLEFRGKTVNYRDGLKNPSNRTPEQRIPISRAGFC